MSVYFHGSFGLNRPYMSDLLAALIKDKNASPEKLAAPFGYGAPFAQKYRTWLVKTGILKASREAQMTPFGEVIWSHDPKFENVATLWFMHHRLSASPENAEAWHFFIKEFLVENSTFSKEDLEEELANKFMPHSMKHFKKGSPMNKVITKKVLECYTETRALGGLKIIIKEGKIFKRGNPSKQGPWKSINQFEEDLIK